MNKYEILKEKLNNIITYIDKMEVKYEASREYLPRYKAFIEKIIEEIDDRSIVNSNGGVLGLIRGISDYGEICDDDHLWAMVVDADKYYSQECEKF